VIRELTYQVIEYGKVFVGFGKGLYGWQVCGIYNRGDEVIPIGYLLLVNDAEQDEELTAITW